MRKFFICIGLCLAVAGCQRAQGLPVANSPDVSAARNEAPSSRLPDRALNEAKPMLIGTTQYCSVWKFTEYENDDKKITDIYVVQSSYAYQSAVSCGIVVAR